MRNCGSNTPSVVASFSARWLGIPARSTRDVSRPLTSGTISRLCVTAAAPNAILPLSRRACWNSALHCVHVSPHMRIRSDCNAYAAPPSSVSPLRRIEPFALETKSSINSCVRPVKYKCRRTTARNEAWYMRESGTRSRLAISLSCGSMRSVIIPIRCSTLSDSARTGPR